MVSINGKGRGAEGLYAKENALKILGIMGAFASRDKAEKCECFVECKICGFAI